MNDQYLLMLQLLLKDERADPSADNSEILKGDYIIVFQQLECY
jgi:hypothetical protein